MTWNEVVSHILERRGVYPKKHFLVGVDGVDGSGKTTFAHNLINHITTEIPEVFACVVSIDNFHQQREFRYRQGRDSPRGYFEDSFDYESLKELVLIPLEEAGGLACQIFLKVHDLETDVKQAGEPISIPAASIVIVEGVFLHRPELREFFDFSIFLDVPFEESVRRMSERDGSPADVSHPALRRYIEGQKIYLDECQPRERANLLILN
jgi:uridine kinase